MSRAEREVVRLVRQMSFRLTELERAQANVLRPGKVLAVDHDKKLVQVDTGIEPAPWRPWLDHSGSLREWKPPVVGQKVMMFSPSGDIANGFVLAGGFSDQFPAPHDKAGEYRLAEVGNAAIDIKDGEIVLTVGGKRVVITADEIVTYGKTRLNNGTARIHRMGDTDTDGDTMLGGADDAFA